MDAIAMRTTGTIQLLERNMETRMAGIKKMANRWYFP